MIPRLTLAFAAAFLLTTPVAPDAAPPPPPAQQPGARVTAVAVALDPSDPARTRLGPLKLVRAWELHGSDAAFGGISALHVAGGDVLAVTDAGVVLRFPVPRGSRPGALATIRLPSLSGDSGAKAGRDSEALAVAGDTAWMGFEGANAIARYRLPDFAPLGVDRPPAMRDWPTNGGPEAMVRLPDGALLVFAEGRDDAETSPALRLGSGAAMPFRYRPPAGYRITDAALLPDGRLLLLHRRFTLLDGVSARLAVADPGSIRQDAVLEPEVIAAWAPPLTIDNMEAISVERSGGRTFVWIASDDNFNPLQRTLLLQFEWPEG